LDYKEPRKGRTGSRPCRLELRVYEKPKREKIMMRMRVKRYREKLKALAQKCNVTLQNRRTET